MLDEFLESSDELHGLMMTLLENVQLAPGMRIEMGMVACSLALEHALSLRLLVRTSCYTSAVSMLRLQYEALARGIWLLYAATDRQVETLASPLSVISEQAAKKMPMFSEMLKEIHRTAPAIPSKMLQSFKDVNYQAMNSYVHSGIHPLRRHSEGYPEGLVRGVVTSSNGLSVMALQLGLILTGDSRLGGLVQEIQMDYSDLLPEIISPLH